MNIKLYQFSVSKSLLQMYGHQDRYQPQSIESQEYVIHLPKPATNYVFKRDLSFILAHICIKQLIQKYIGQLQINSPNKSLSRYFVTYFFIHRTQKLILDETRVLILLSSSNKINNFAKMILIDNCFDTIESLNTSHVGTFI